MESKPIENAVANVALQESKADMMRNRVRNLSGALSPIINITPPYRDSSQSPYKEYDGFGEWQHEAESWYYSDNHTQDARDEQSKQFEIKDADTDIFKKYIEICERLIDTGGLEGIRQAQVMEMALRNKILEHLPKLFQYKIKQDLVHHSGLIAEKAKLVDNIHKDIVSIEKDTEKIPLKPIIPASPDVIKTVATAFESAPDGSSVAVEGNFMESGLQFHPWQIALRKDGFQMDCSLPDVTQTNPDSPVNTLKTHIEKAKVRDRIEKFIKDTPERNEPGLKRLSKEQRDKMRFENAFILSDLCRKAVVEPSDAQTQARLATAGLLVQEPEFSSSDVIKDFFEKLAVNLAKREAPIKIKGELQPEEQAISVSSIGLDPKKNQKIEFQTAGTKYRVAYDKEANRLQLNIISSSLPTRKQIFDEALLVSNKVYGELFDYLGIDLAGSGVLSLPPELEKTARIEFHELEDKELFDLDHMAGVDPALVERARKYARAVRDYSDGETHERPPLLIISGPRGVGKSSLVNAILNELRRSGEEESALATIATEPPACFEISRNEPVNQDTLIRGLQTLLNMPAGILKVEDVELLLGWNAEDISGVNKKTEQARATMHRLLDDIDQSPGHIVILDTEHIAGFTGPTEGLARRDQHVEFKRDMTTQGMDDLLRGVIARFETVKEGMKIRKSDHQVDAQLERLFGSKDSAQREIIYNKMLDLAKEYEPKGAYLTVDAVAKAMSETQWRSATIKDVITLLETNLSGTAKAYEGILSQRQLRKENQWVAVYDEQATQIAAMQSQIAQLASQMKDMAKLGVSATPAETRVGKLGGGIKSKDAAAESSDAKIEVIEKQFQTLVFNMQDLKRVTVAQVGQMSMAFGEELKKIRAEIEALKGGAKPTE